MWKKTSLSIVFSSHRMVISGIAAFMSPRSHTAAFPPRNFVGKPKKIRD
ncbi:MAG: hypothetical protein RBR08_11715 [Desulforegulaceae bacterium]|nr:hypothetical protein [Desulforegulaceae bacterium]